MASSGVPASGQNHIRRCARLLGSFVETAAHIRRKDKVLLEMRNVLEENSFVVECDVIEDHEVLMQLPHIAHVRHDRQAKFLCHQTDREKLAHARKPGAIGLNEMHPSIVEEILEKNA